MYEAADLLYILLLAACISAANYLITRAIARSLSPPAPVSEELLLPFTGSHSARPTSLVLPHSFRPDGPRKRKKREEADSSALAGEEAAVSALPAAQEELHRPFQADSPAREEEEAVAPAPPSAQEDPQQEADSPALAGEEAAVPALPVAQEANREERRQADTAGQGELPVDSKTDSQGGEGPDSQTHRSAIVAEIEALVAAAPWSADINFVQNTNRAAQVQGQVPEAPSEPGSVPSLQWDTSSEEEENLQIVIHRSTPEPQYWVPQAGPARAQQTQFQQRFWDWTTGASEPPLGQGNHIPGFPDKAKDAVLARKFQARRQAVSKHYAEVRESTKQRLEAKEQRSLQNHAARRQHGGSGGSPASRGRGQPGTAGRGQRRPASASSRRYGHRPGQAQPPPVATRNSTTGGRQPGTTWASAECPACGHGRHRKCRPE